MTDAGEEGAFERDTAGVSASVRARELLRDRVRHIAIEGVIGVGKTTLARSMADVIGARLVLERFEENPFLEAFYEEPDRWAFHTQLSFLASRFRQQQELAARDLFHHGVVSDYAFEKDRIFASVTLEGDEMALYETLYRAMEPSTPAPDLVIFLRATVDRLLRNIERRGRPYEARISESYLQDLSSAYDYFFFRYKKCPVVIVNMEKVDFVKQPDAVEDLIRQVGTATYRGTIYYRAGRSDPH